MKYFEDFKIGEEFQAGERKITEDDIIENCRQTWDLNELHISKKRFNKNKNEQDIIMPGFLTAQYALGLISSLGLYDKTTIGMKSTNLKFPKPVFPDDRIKIILKVKNKIEKDTYGDVYFDCTVYNQDNDVVLRFDYVLVVEKMEKINNIEMEHELYNGDK